MPQMSNFIKKLEGYTDLEVSIIRQTKINKVLKALIKLNTIPRDEEFNFRKRSLELLTQWNKILGAEPPEADAGTDKEAKASPATNGVHDEKTEDSPAKKTEESTEKPEATEEKSAEEKPAEEKPVEETSEEKPAPENEPESKPAEAPAAPSAEPPASTEEPKPADVVEESPKVDAPAPVPAPEVVEKVPESAPAAAEASEVVKATE